MPETPRTLTAALHQEEDWFIAQCLEVDVGRTTDVEPYPVQLGSRYHDGKPDEPGKDWWGTVTGFQPPGSPDFHHTIAVPQLRATVDVHIHYSFEPENARTRASRWLVLDISMPAITRPLRRLIISSFDKETCGPWRQSRNTPRHTPVMLTTTEQKQNWKERSRPRRPPRRRQRDHSTRYAEANICAWLSTQSAAPIRWSSGILGR